MGPLLLLSLDEDSVTKLIPLVSLSLSLAGACLVLDFFGGGEILLDS